SGRILYVIWLCYISSRAHFYVLGYYGNRVFVSKMNDFDTGSTEGRWCPTHHRRADVRPSLQQFSNSCTVQCMLTIDSRLVVMNRLGRALAAHTRSRNLLPLLGDPAYPSALAQELELTRSSVSIDLTCLRDCGIVVAEAQGRKTRYEIVDAHLVQALN